MFVVLLFWFCSLVKRGKKRFAENRKEVQKKEVILTNIQKAGFFMTRQ
jgi:hypothetical protein